MPRLTLLDYFENFPRRGAETAYVHRRGYRLARWTYRQVADTANQFARELATRAINPGDRVLLWGENCPEWVAAFWGCLLQGVIVVPMDQIAAPDFVRRVTVQVAPKLLVASRAQDQLEATLPSLTFEDLPAAIAHHDRSPFPPPPVKREDTVQIVFTSGTTAEPKGVVISHRNIMANLEPLEEEIKKYLKYERLVHPLRFLNLLPLSHVFGQFLGLFVPPILGSTVVFQESLNPSEVMRTIKRERVSVLVTVPRLLETLRDKIERDQTASGRADWWQQQLAAAEHENALKRWWRFRRLHRQFGWKFWAFISGGAALDAATESFWSRLGFAVIQGYGLTETTSLISVNHPFKIGRGSIGQVLPGREIKLSETGEILVRGENIAAGYWQGQELKPVLGQEGWFQTGDMGALDAQGNLYFKGRQKNVIVTAAGMNIYPEDLEAALRHQPAVRDCVVVALARNGNAEPCAVLILRDGAEAEAVVKQANESLAEFQQMRSWFVWPEEDFPRTSTQKPRTNLIQEQVQAQLSGRATAAAPAGSLAELIGRITGQAPAALSPTANLTQDLNLSSIDRVELLSALEDHYQIDLNETRFTAATTVGELEQMLRQPAAPRSAYRYPRWAQRWPVTWLRWLVYYLLSYPATLLLGYPRIRGRENLRGVKGPVLVVANHIASADIGFVLVALPPRFRHYLAAAMEGERLRLMHHPPAEWNKLKRWYYQLQYFLVVALFNVFPLPQRSGFRESFTYAGESVDRGYNVLVFPEGARTETGEMAPFRAGIGLLVNNLNLPVVPLRIDGLFELKQAGRRMTRPGKVRVSIGAPVRFAPETAPEIIAEQLQERIVALHWPTKA